MPYALSLPFTICIRANLSQIFKVKIQGDTVGSRLKEVQEKTQNLATFGNDIAGYIELV